MIVDLIHIHEDDERLRNLYPLAAAAGARADLEDAVAASARNRDASGIGWTDVHFIGKPSVTYADLDLRLADVAAVMPPAMPRIKRFYMTASGGFDLTSRDPYGSYEEDAWCYGFSRECYLKIDTEGPLVAGIWFECWGTNEAQTATLRSAIEAIDRLSPGIVVDYAMPASGSVGDKVFMDRYFRQLVDGDDD